jgi:hypothetical protein
MRKIFVALLLIAVFAAGLSVGFLTPKAEAKPTKCWYVCDGDVTMKCCRYGPVVQCLVYADGCIE